MNQTDMTFDVIKTAFAILFVVVGYLTLWRDYCIDRLRHNLAKLESELTRKWSEDVSVTVNHEAYSLVMSLIQIVNQEAAKISFFNGLASYKEEREATVELKELLQQKSSDLSTENQDLLLDTYDNTIMQMKLHVIKTSIFCSTIFVSSLLAYQAAKKIVLFPLRSRTNSHVSSPTFWQQLQYATISGVFYLSAAFRGITKPH